MSPDRGRPRIERDIRIVSSRREEVEVRHLARNFMALARAEQANDTKRREQEATDEPA